MASRQVEKDRRLALLVHRQEAFRVTIENDTDSGYPGNHLQQDIDRAIKLSLDQSPGRIVSTSQSEDVETDGPSVGQRSSTAVEPFSVVASAYRHSIPQVNGQPVSMVTKKSDSDERDMESTPEEDIREWRETSNVPDNGTGAIFFPDSDSDENFDENEITRQNENNEELPEIEGASSGMERRRSIPDADDDEIAREIEELLKHGSLSASEAESVRENQERKFRLNNMTKWQKNNDDTELRPFVFDTDGIPINWTADIGSTNQLLRHGHHSMDVVLVQLHPGQMEYDKINEEFNESQIQITKIERIQNTFLLDRFKSEMEDTKRRRHHGFDLNIQYLYHGTKADKACICEEGLDQRLSRLGYFGKGIYFSDNPLKCVYYAENMDGLGDAYILKCRVILGDAKCYPDGEYDTSLKREPEKDKGDVRPGLWRFYDSVVGCPRDYNEFVVYENRRAMIEYIISFKVGPEGAAALKQDTASRATNSEVVAEVTDNSHIDRIRDVRETVRMKRCKDKGIPYMELTQEGKQHDDHRWNKLQVLHGVKSSHNTNKKIIPGAGKTSDTSIPKISNTRPFESPGAYSSGMWEDFSAFGTDLSGGGNYDCDDDPVEQVMSGLLQEFLGVTDTDDVEIAKYYITQNKMNINEAIMNYYNDLP